MVRLRSMHYVHSSMKCKYRRILATYVPRTRNSNLEIRFAGSSGHQTAWPLASGLWPSETLTNMKGCLNKGLCQEQHIQESSQGLFADFVMHTYSLLSKLLVSKAI